MTRPLAVVPAVDDAVQGTRLDFEAEASLARCGALKDFWYVACLSRELGTAAVARQVLGVPLVLFRDAHGVARALADRCLHRNAPLSAGVVDNGCLACPYHGWTYDGDGRCVSIPSLGPSQRGAGVTSDARLAGTCAPDDLGRVETFPVIEQDGLVFVLPSQDVARARRPPYRVPYVDDKRWRVYFMVTSFENGVTNLVENFMDVPHTVFVHEGWFRRRAQKRVPARVERKDGAVLVTYLEGSDRISGLGRLLNPSGAAMIHTDRFEIPNITRVDYGFGGRGLFVINSQCTPKSAYSSIVYTAIAFRSPIDLPNDVIARVFEPLVRWYTRKVIEQDVDIMRLQASGLRASEAPPRFRCTEADLLHADIEAYRRWLCAGGEGAGPDDAVRDIAFWI